MSSQIDSTRSRFPKSGLSSLLPAPTKIVSKYSNKIRFEFKLVTYIMICLYPCLDQSKINKSLFISKIKPIDQLMDAGVEDDQI